MSPTSYSNDVNSLQQCLASLHTWFCENGMALKFSTHPNQLPPSSARLSESSPYPVLYTFKRMAQLFHFQIVKIPGATLDSNLTMDNHTKSVSINLVSITSAH